MFKAPLINPDSYRSFKRKECLRFLGMALLSGLMAQLLLKYIVLSTLL